MLMIMTMMTKMIIGGDDDDEDDGEDEDEDEDEYY